MGSLRSIVILPLAGVLALSLVTPAWPSSEASPRIVRSLPLPDAGPAPTSGADASSSTCTGAPRSTIDRPDIRDGRVVHVIYMLATDAPDEAIDTTGILECSLRGQQAWIKRETGLQWKLDKTVVRKRLPRKKKRKPRYVSTELLDVTFVRSAHTVAELNGAGIVSGELELLGFNEEDKRYLTYVAGSGGGACGDAYWPFTSSDPNSDGQYAQVYLLSSEGCMAKEFGTATEPSFSETIAQQEIMHNDGIVPLGAPHGCGPLSLPAHVCTGPLVVAPFLDPENFDILFPYVGVALNDKKVDLGHDDYFRHGLPRRDLKDSPYLEPAS